jgi:uncharacterized protein YecE (DUF72 family)
MDYPVKYFAGMSGIELPVPKYQYPPQFQNTSRLTYYGSLFNSIEVNSTFYKIPQQNTIARWASSVNDGFRFTFKLFKKITHCKGLQFDVRDIKHFIDSISAIGEKKACILIQFPPSLSADCIEQLANLLAEINRYNAGKKWQVAVEFRNKSWYYDDVYNLLKEFGATLVIHDIPKSKTPFDAVSSETVYLRFHGPTGNYDGSYSDSFLAEYSDYIQEWLKEGRTVYVYFNNTKGDAFNNLITLNSMISEAKSELSV